MSRYVCFVSVLFLALATASSQEQGTVLRTTTRLVTVSAVVKDKSGKPVPDLTRDDFVLLEESKPQVIDFFTLESNRQPARTNAVLPANAYTNRPAEQGSVSPNVCLILLDSLNAQISDLNYAREQTIKFLDQIRPEDRVAIYAMTWSGVQVIHDFSSDSVSLRAALMNYRVRHPLLPKVESINVEAPPLLPPAQADTEAARRFAESLDTFFENARQAYDETDRILKTTLQMRGVANYLSRFPGRKNVLWVTSGFPVLTGSAASTPRLNQSPTGTSYIRATEQLARTLATANLIVYPIDARGLWGAMQSAATTIRGEEIPGGKWYTREDHPVSFADSASSGTDSMNLLADETGGKLFHNRNDIERAIRSAIDDGQVSYMLGYYPTHGKWDGRFVKVKVKVNRPGLQVQARTGYYAASKATLDEKTIVSLLEDSALSPLDASTIGLTVYTEPSDRRAGNTLKFVIDIDPRDLTLLLENRAWVGGVNLMLMLQSADGSVLSRTVQWYDLRLTPEERDRMEKSGLTIDHSVELKENAYRLRVVVHDSRSGGIGAVSVPLK